MPRYVNPKPINIAGLPAPVKRVRITKKMAIKGVGSISSQLAIRVEGVDKIIGKLESLPPKVQKKVLKTALRSGGKKVLKRAKELVPVDADGHQLPGGKHLRQTLKLRTAKAKRRGDVSFKVVTGTRKELGIPADEKGFYPFALEYGDVLHWQPIPYMRPAYKQTEQPVIASARREIAQGISDIVRGG